MESDPELLRRFTDESSQEAFSEFVRRNVDFVYAAALRQTGSRHRAEDVVQIVFTDLARKAPALAGRTEFLGWLHRSARLTSIRIRRDEARREARERKADIMQESDARAAEGAAERARLVHILDAELARLGEKDREAVLLRYLRGHSFREVGSALGVTEEAARKRVDRALAALRQGFGRRGVTSSLVALELALEAQAGVTAPAGFGAAVAAQAGAQTVPLSFLARLGLHLGSSHAPAAVVLAVAVAAVGFAVKEQVRLDSEQKARGSEQRSAAVLEKRSAELQRDLAEGAARQTALEKSIADRKRTIAETIDRLSHSKMGKRAVDAGLSLLSDPKVIEIGRQFDRRFIGWYYFPAFAALGLSPAEISQFEAVALGPVTATTFGTKMKVIDEGDGHVEITFALDGEPAVSDQGALERWLGARNAQFDAITPSLFLRHEVVDKLAGNLLYTDAPLTRVQAERLVKVLATNQSPGEGPPDESRVEWPQALKQAGGFLSPQQVDELGRLSGLLSSSWSEGAP